VRGEIISLSFMLVWPHMEHCIQSGLPNTRGKLTHWSESSRGHHAGQGLEHRTHKERLSELGLPSLQKNQLWGDHGVWDLTALTGSAASSPSLPGVCVPALKVSSDTTL